MDHRSTISFSNRPVSRRLYRRQLAAPGERCAYLLPGLTAMPTGPTLVSSLRRSVVREAGMLELLAAEMRIAELEKALEKAREEAHLDPLTGALNRRGFDKACQRELSRIQRKATHYAIVYIDLDDFKKLNDTLGHHVGDQALVHLVSLLQQSMRPSDVLGRFGGEEFVMMLPETSEEGAITAVSRILDEFSVQAIPGTMWQLSFSAGVAASKAGEAFDEVMRRAEAAAYIAKRHGKRRVVAG